MAAVGRYASGSSWRCGLWPGPSPHAACSAGRTDFVMITSPDPEPQPEPRPAAAGSQADPPSAPPDAVAPQSDPPSAPPDAAGSPADPPSALPAAAAGLAATAAGIGVGHLAASWIGASSSPVFAVSAAEPVEAVEEEAAPDPAELAWRQGWKETYGLLDSTERTLLFEIAAQGRGEHKLGPGALKLANELVLKLDDNWKAYAEAAFQSLAELKPD